MVNPPVDALARRAKSMPPAANDGRRRRRVSAQPAAPIAVDLSVLLHWQHRRGGQAHCLAQLHAAAAGPRLVVLSELATNPDHLGLSGDVAGAADQLIPLLQRLDIPPAAVTWLLHHGPFSYYDPSGPETWTRVNPRWDGGRAVDALEDHELVADPSTITALARIAPVERALQDLATPEPRP